MSHTCTAIPTIMSAAGATPSDGEGKIKETPRIVHLRHHDGAERAPHTDRGVAMARGAMIAGPRAAEVEHPPHDEGSDAG
jgi:hypothetical protein